MRAISGSAISGTNTSWIAHKGVLSPQEKALYLSTSDGVGELLCRIHWSSDTDRRLGTGLGPNDGSIVSGLDNPCGVILFSVRELCTDTISLAET